MNCLPAAGAAPGWGVVVLASAELLHGSCATSTAVCRCACCNLQASAGSSKRMTGSHGLALPGSPCPPRAQPTSQPHSSVMRSARGLLTGLPAAGAA